MTTNRKHIFLIPLTYRMYALLLLTVAAMNSDLNAGYVPSHDSLYFFYQRTTYLENLTVAGSWWSNPALVSEIEKTTVLTANSGPLGGVYTIASARFIFGPVKGLTFGAGATGAGGNQDRMFLASQEGADYSSHFSFTRPSIEMAISTKLPFAGSAGVLQSIGTELVPQPTGGDRAFFAWGSGLGLISPAFFDIVALSFSSLSVYHAMFEGWWDHNVKLGLRFSEPGKRVTGALEYAFSPGDRFTLFTGAENTGSYEVLKGTVSIAARQIIGILLGLSMDTENRTSNGTMFHGGLELRRSDLNPFYAGYEVGVGFRQQISVLHRIWLGYSFAKPSAD